MQVIRMDVVEVEGRAIEGVKILGTLPQGVYLDGDDDFTIYVRWMPDGSVRADRSDTDRMIVAASSRNGKYAAFRMLMENLSRRFGTPVVVGADSGVTGAQLAKMAGEYVCEGVSTTAEVTEMQTRQACSAAGCKTGDAPVMLLKIATGPSAKYTNDVYFCGTCWKWYEHSTELGNVVESVSLGTTEDTRHAAWVAGMAGDPNVEIIGGHPYGRESGLPIFRNVADNSPGILARHRARIAEEAAIKAATPVVPAPRKLRKHKSAKVARARRGGA